MTEEEDLKQMMEERHIPADAVPLFAEADGSVAFIKNTPNPHLPRYKEPATTPIYKNVVEHRQMVTLTEARAIQKAYRPDAVTSVNGVRDRPDMGRIEKSMSGSRQTVNEPIYIGMDPKKAVEKDWEDYNLYMSSGKF